MSLVLEHDVEVLQIFGQPAHFDVIALADDHGMIAVAHERLHRAMRDVDERAGRFDDRRARWRGCGPASGPRRRARSPSPSASPPRDVAHAGDPLAAGRQDLGVVDEIAEDGQRAGLGVLEGQLDGVPDAEAHPHVRGSQDRQR